MTDEEILDEFRAANALLEGHFILPSGLHSPRYLHCSRVMMDARRGGRLCRVLGERIADRVGRLFDIVVSPAPGGIVVGYEVGRQLDVPAIFMEQEAGRFEVRRGFEIPEAARCLMVEDVVTTGVSSREFISAIEDAGGHVVAGACLVDRSGGEADIGIPLVALLTLDVPVYSADALPPELRAIPAFRPGAGS